MKSTPPARADLEMVMKALLTLKERNGSSLPAIKKFISSTYKVRARQGLDQAVNRTHH